MLTLYSTPLSANGRKVLAVARQLEVKANVRLVNVYRGEGRTAQYLSINPTGKIPTLVDGDLTLFESNAILQYLSEAYGDYRLWSRDAKERARIARWLYWESAHWQPILTRILSPCVGHRLLPDIVPRPSGTSNWDAAELPALFNVLDPVLKHSPFLVGEEVSIADFAVAGMVTYFSAARFPFERYEPFAEWYGRIGKLEGWQATQDALWTA